MTREHTDISTFFSAKSIAVVGASNNTQKIGGYLFSQLLNQDSVTPYPVNPKEDMIQEHQAFSSISKLPEVPDLVLIAIPAPFVNDVLKECGEKGARQIVIISAGFKEVGEEGKKRESTLKETINHYQLQVIGPNCLGILNPLRGLNCSFAKDLPRNGTTALVSQSGAVIDALIDWSFKHHIGFSRIISLGNMAGVDEKDVLRYLCEDQKTEAIVFYMETITEGKEFAKLIKELSPKKPVIIIKPGNSEGAKQAIGSHTGSLAQDNQLVETLIKDHNGILVNSLNELYNILIGLKAKANAQKDITIVTNAGGPGVIATDETERNGFRLQRFSTDAQQRLKQALPEAASVKNPIDVLGDARSDRYEAVIRELISLEDVHTIMVLLTPQIMTDTTEIAKQLCILEQSSDTCLISCLLGDKEVREGIEYLDTHDFANFQTPSEALNALHHLRDYHGYDAKDHPPQYRFDHQKIKAVRKKIAQEEGLLCYATAKEVLECLSIRLPFKQVISDPEELQRPLHLNSLKNYVIKADGKAFVHKKEIGGVITGVTGDRCAEEAKVLLKKIQEDDQNATVTIEEEIKGRETMIGLKQDPSLGNFILFGTGGTYVNIFKDIAFASCPISRNRAQSLIAETKIAKALEEFRGSNAVDQDKLVELLCRLSFLQELFPEIREVDFNPVICNEHGIYPVDVKLLLRKENGTEEH